MPVLEALPLPAIPDGYAALLPALPPHTTAAHAFVHRLTDLPTADIGAGFTVKDGETLVGVGLLKTGNESPDAAQIVVAVAPSYRRQGWGRKLLTALETAAAQQGRQNLRASVRATDGTLPFAAACGWAEAYADVVQEADAHAVASLPSLPSAEFTVIDRYAPLFSDAQSPHLYETYAEAAPYITAFFPQTDFERSLSEERPFNRLVCAWDKGVCVGFAWGQDAAPDAVFHEFTGIRPAYRGRGLATLLKIHLAQAALRANRTRLLTCNRAGNEAILAVNRKMGYRVAAQCAQLEKRLSPVLA